MKKISNYKSFKLNESWEEDDDLDNNFEDDGDDGDDYIDDDSDEEYQNDDFDSEMIDLCNVIKKLYDNSELSVNIDYDGLNIIVYVFFNKKEKIKTLTKTFDVANKLRKDILPQYDSEFELYENEEGDPIICFEFTFNDDEPIIRTMDDDDDKYSRSGARLF